MIKIGANLIRFGQIWLDFKFGKICAKFAKFGQNFGKLIKIGPNLIRFGQNQNLASQKH